MREERGDDAIRLVVGFPKKMNLCMRGYADKYLRDTRIKPPYLILIFHIGRREGISQKELIDEVPFDKSYISIMVHDMIDIGLIYNDGEGKQHSLHLTDRGRDVYVMSRMMFDLLDRNLFDVLTDEEKESLRGIMGKLDSRLDKLMADFSQEGE